MADDYRPAVSIIIPSYNSLAWVDDAVGSALGQTYPNTEIIVVDDGSTDGTAEHLRRRFGARIRCVSQRNRGLAGARNRGLRETGGELVQFLDADDMILENKIAEQVEAFARRPDVSVVYSDYQYVTDDAERRRSTGEHSHRYAGGDVWPDLLKANFLVCHSALARRSAIAGAGGFHEALTAYEDWDLWLRLAHAGHRFHYHPGVLALYRKRAGNMRSDAVHMRRNKVRVLRRMPGYASWERLGGRAHHRERVRVARRRLAESLRAAGRGGAWRQELLAALEGAWAA